MNIITAIQIQKKNKDKYNIFLDNQYAFSVFENTLIHFSLVKNMTLTSEQQLNIMKYDAFEKLYHKALVFISYKMRTKKEVKDKLQTIIEQDTQWNEEIIDSILTELEQNKFIDDLLYIDLFIEENHLTKKKGYKAVIFDLMQKGIDKQTILQHAKFSLKKEHENALFLATAYLKQQKLVSFKHKQQKLFQFLLKKGFSTDVVKHTIDNLNLEIDEEVELLTIQKIAHPIVKKYMTLYDSKSFKYKLKDALYRKGFTKNIINQYIEQVMEEIEHYNE